ncbi:hypothetical protein E2320_003493 [Naja naja]|nr:hypothetical protein E2320_003493 [Naja naja]
MEQGGGLLSGGLAMDLDHPMGTQYSANPPVTIDVPMTDISTGLMGHGQLTTIDQSELSSQLGLSLGGIVLDIGKKQKAPKKQKKKKDPNEPQKPVSAYALFFRDTQAAIKGQNPKATFGEVSKIVASMWDSLGEEQKQTTVETVELDPIASPSEQSAPVVESASPPAPVPPNPPALESPPPPPPPAIVPAQPTVVVTSSAGPQSAGQTSITKIIIPKQMLPSSLAVTSQGGVVTVIPATMVTSRGIQLGQLQAGTGTTQIVTRSVLAAAAAAASSMHLPRLQPPPLQQMPQQPPAQPVTILQQPPPLQAMQQPPLQQKVRLNLQQPPPPLQIKILPPPALQIQPIALRSEDGSPERTSTELQTSPEPIDVESPTQMHVELVSESPVAMSPRPRCIRVGCDNPPVLEEESRLKSAMSFAGEGQENNPPPKKEEFLC